MEDADAVICATGSSGFNVGAVDEQGTKNLVDAAKVGSKDWLTSWGCRERLTGALWMSW